MLGLGNILTKGGALLGFPNKYSFSFDGNDNYLDISTPQGIVNYGVLEPNGITFSAWVNTSVTSGSAFAVVGQGNSTGNGSYLNGGLYINNNKLAMTLYKNSSYNETIGSITLSAGTWYHVCGVYTGESGDDKIKLYVNGSLDTSSSALTGNGLGGAETSAVAFIGRNVNNTNRQYFNGSIDEVGIWDTALDATAIGKISSKVVDLTKHSASNLKLWIRSGDKVLPEEDTSIARSDFYTAFDGGSEVVSISNTVAPTEAITVSAWVNFTSLEDYDLVVGNTDTGSNGWRLAMDNADNIIFAINSWGSNHAETPMSSTGVWHHLVGTYDKSNIKIYLNGELKGTDAYTDSITYSSNVFQIGGASGWSNLTGSISSVGVYKTALDAQTIKQLSKSRFLPQRQAMFSVVDFDGSDDYIAISNNSALSFGTNAHTISAWAKIDALANYKTIISKREAGGTATDYNLSVGSNGEVYTYNGSATAQSANSVISTGTWYHYALVYSGSAYQLYINGSAVAWASGTTTSGASNSHDIGIGWDRSGNYWDGAISSVSLYNVAKSADEVYAQYQKGITHNPSADTGLVGLWRMGDDTSASYPTIADSSSNSNDGTMTSMASDDIQQQAVAMYDMGSYDNSTEELGGELNPNPTFSNFTGDVPDGWTVSGDDDSGNNISQGSGGGLRIQSDGGAIYAQLADVTNVGKVYKYSITLANLIDDDFNFNNSGTTFFTANGSSVGTHTGYFTAVSTFIRIIRLGSCDGEVTAFSLKEVLQSDLSDTYPSIIDVANPTLGAELWDADASTFDSGTHSWVAYGNNTITNDSGALKITYVDNARGAYIYLNKDFNGDLSTNLTVGATYKITLDAKVNSGSSVTINITEGAIATTTATVTETTFTKKIIYFTATSTLLNYLLAQGMSSGEIVYIDNISMKEVQGNVGTMTSMATDNLTYSSVLPDQSFLATGNSSPYNFLDLDGTDAKVTLSSQQSLTGDFTISGWMNRANEDLKVFFSDSNSGTKLNYLFITETTKNLGIDFQGLTLIEFSNSNPPHSEWFHFAITRNAKIFKCYVNGSLTDTEDKSSAGAYDQTWTYNQIGTYFSGSYWIDASFSNFAIHNKELIASEISAIHTAGRHTNLLDSYSDNLKNYYAFGALDSKTGLADTDSTIYDRSGNSVHGTTSGSATGDLKSPPNATPSSGYSKGDTNRSTDVK